MAASNPRIVFLSASLLAGLSTHAAAQVVSAPLASPLAQADASLPPVVVQGTRQRDGDYRTDKLDSLGPLGSTQILDAPYAISVLPEDLIENSQARNFKEVSKYLPLVSYQEQQGPQILRPQTRGMQGGNFQNSRLDGMTMYVTVANALEQFQQIEVLNGVSASLYGPANPAGMFNFVSKRPTDTPLRRVGVSHDEHGIVTGYLDLSDRIDDAGVVRYRLNLLAGDGGGYVGGSRLDRKLGDLGVDIRPRRDTVIELNYSDYHLTQTGYPGWFTYGETVVLPKAPDPTKVGYGQTYAGVDMDTKIATGRVKVELNPNWHLVVGLLNQDATRDINTPVNNLRNNAGAYTASLANGFAPRFIITSDMAYLDGRFSTGALTHDLTLGTAGYRSQSYAVSTPASAASVLLGTASIDNPQTFALPAAGLPNSRANYDASTIYQQGVNVADTIGFNEQWSTRLAVSQDWFHVANYNARGAGLAGYVDDGQSPTASLIFKPQKNMTTYLTYASSLQAGDVAPGTAANAGVGLAPYRSKEVEAGFKASLNKIDFTAAIFKIDRPFANTDTADNVFKISGDQVNTGVEFSASGEVVDRLTAVGGFTVINARLRNTPVASADDKLFVGTPRYKGNLLLEYRVPGLEGLVASVDWQYSGKRPGNDVNSFFVDGYSLFDLGARYHTKIGGKDVTLRVAVDNIADKHYWSTVAPSNITGTNTGNLVAHLGSPRTLLSSVSVDF